MCVYVHVCIYISIYIHTHIYTHTFTNKQYSYEHICLYNYIYSYITPKPHRNITTAWSSMPRYAKTPSWDTRGKSTANSVPKGRFDHSSWASKAAGLPSWLKFRKQPVVGKGNLWKSLDFPTVPVLQGCSREEFIRNPQWMLMRIKTSQFLLKMFHNKLIHKLTSPYFMVKSVKIMFTVNPKNWCGISNVLCLTIQCGLTSNKMV